MTFTARLVSLTTFDALASDYVIFAESAARQKRMELKGPERIAVFLVEGSASIQVIILEGLQGEEGYKTVIDSLAQIQLELEESDKARLQSAMGA